jgi:hypothetical protein
MIDCSMVEPVRSDQQQQEEQEEVEKKNLYTIIYTTGVSEHQLPFQMDGVVAGDTNKKQGHSA